MIETKIIHKSGELSRITNVTLNGKDLQTPAYFPSVSSYGVKLSLSYLIYLLASFNYRYLLVSAYDLWNTRDTDKDLSSALKKFNQSVREKKNGFLFLDSGNYESFWYKNSKWDFNAYKTIVNSVDSDLYSCFDIIPILGSSDDEKQLGQAFSNICESSSLQSNGQLVTILHGLTPEKTLKVLNTFLDKHLKLCNIIAIPERDCGNGIYERAQTIREVRKLLNRYDEKIILHILGCGDPLSILLFSYCGADSFDSLDWYEHVFDANTLFLRDLSHFELLKCDCDACRFLLERSKVKEVVPLDKYVIHNLYNYQSYITQIQERISNNKLVQLVSEKFGKNVDIYLK